MNNHIYSTLFKIKERESDRSSKEIEQRKESQNTHIKQGQTCDLTQGRHRFNTSGAILENYSLHGATRPKVNTRSLDGSRKSGGAIYAFK